MFRPNLNDYQQGHEITRLNPGFYSIIQAAMRKANDNNLAMLKECWPFVWQDLQARYKAPGGRLEGKN